MLSKRSPTAVLSRKQRLSLATGGAIALHCILFISGWLVIHKISIPSNDSRVMVLTLESTQLDGLQESEVTPSETMNDAKLGEATSMPERPELSELSQLSTAPHPKPTFEVDPEMLVEPLPELESADHLRTNELTEQPLDAQVIQSLTPTTSQPFAEIEPSEPAGQLLNAEGDLVADPVSLSDLILAQQNTLQIAPVTAQSESELALPIGSKQQRMLERKIQQWARKLEATEYVDQTFSWRHKGQSFSATFEHLPASGPMDLDEMIVEVTTDEDGQSLSTVMRLKKLAFSNFAQFVHRWDPSVMIHDDEMEGRFHSNSQILVDFDRRARPVFHGKVTTASYKIDFESNARGKTRREIFRGGLETGVKRINMPKPQMLFAESKEVLANDTLMFTEDTRLVFTPEGGVMIQPISATGEPQYQKLPSHPMYLIADDGVTLSVSGKARGKIMVYSPVRIIIENDITYADANFANSEDVLGLVSGKDVVIAGKEVTGEGDLTINASIYARRRFLVRDFASARSGMLRILGSVSAGSVSATQPRFGTKIIFDKRFEKLRPPGFPVTGRYEVNQDEWVWSPINQTSAITKPVVEY